MKRLEGTVASFNDAKGYGFIDFGGEKLFVHYKSIVGDGMKSLTEGQIVTFDVKPEEQITTFTKKSAVNVIKTGRVAYVPEDEEDEDQRCGAI